MLYMFQNCSFLTILDLSSFNTQNVTTMENVFDGCKSLSILNLSSFSLKKGVVTSCMFNRCKQLNKEIIEDFNRLNK